MELASTKKNASDSGWTTEFTGEEEADFGIDLRLDSRWKRRRIEWKNPELNSCSKKSPNKTMHWSNKKNDDPVEAEIVDPGYQKFLNDMEVSVDFDVGVDTDTRCIDGDAKKAMHQNIESNDPVLEPERVGGDGEKSLNDMKDSVDFDVGVDNYTRYSDGCANKAMYQTNETNDAVVEPERFDQDYEKFLNNMEGSFDFVVGVDNDTRSNDGGANKAMCQNNETNDAVVEPERVDQDYEKFLNDMEGSVDFDVGVDNDARSNDGGAKKAMHLNIEIKDSVAVPERVDPDYKQILNDMEGSVDFDVDNDTMCSDGIANKAMHWNNETYDAIVEPERVDPDYKKFLNDVEGSVDFDVVDNDTIYSDGGANEAMHQNNETNDAIVKPELVDPDYKKFLNDMEGSFDFGVEIDNDTRYSDQGANKAIHQNNDTNDADVVTVDSDYEKFLNDIKQYDADARSVNYFDYDDVSEFVDPHYKMFLDNLKEDGKSYVLELALGETSVVVKYEKEDGSDNSLDAEGLETTKCYRKQGKVRNLNVSKCYSEGENIENPRRVLRSDSRRQKIESPRKTLRSRSRRKNNENPSIMHDVANREKIGIARNCRSNSRNNESSSILHNPLGRNKDDSARRLGKVCRRESMGTQRKLRASAVKKNVAWEAQDPVSAKNVCSSKRHHAKGTYFAKHQYNNGVKSDLVDENYLEFLNLMLDGQHYTPEGGKKVVDEESDFDSKVEKEADDPVSCKLQYNPGVKSDLVDESYLEYLKFVKDDQNLENLICDESDSDSEVIILSNNPFSDEKHTTLIDLDDEDSTKNHTGSEGSEFRKKLTEILLKPYDEVECEKLWRDASDQRRSQGVRRLRDREKTYELNSYGRSYLELDEHKDLAALIDEAQCDKRRILNLLRGFFFWLQNLVHGGQFRPWLDSSCLSILPPD